MEGGAQGCNSSGKERSIGIITTRGERCERLLGISGSPAARSVRGRASSEELDYKDDLLPEERVFVRARVCVMIWRIPSFPGDLQCFDQTE